MVTFLDTGKPSPAVPAARIVSRALAVVGLTLPLVLLAYRDLGAEMPLHFEAPTASDSSLSPALIEAMGGMRYGLTSADVDNYRRLLAAADHADWGRARVVSPHIADHRLMGHVLAARYLAADAKPAFEDLRAWMDLYRDLPEADDIYQRAIALKPASAISVPRPRGEPVAGSPVADGETPAPTEPHTSAGDRAFTRFFSTDDKGALGDALRAIAVLGERASTSRWIAGLAAWRLGQLQEAERHFAALAASRSASGWMAAAGAYWAGRVEERKGVSAAAAKWFGAAGRYPTTFYGMLALRKLGVEIAQQVSAASVGPSHLDALAQNPAGYRAIALLQIGRRDLAAAELERLDPAGDPRLEEALIVVADAAHLGELSPILAQRIARPGDDASKRYPIPAWQPHGGFKVDPALVFAVARQESRFEPSVVSPAGATGLMQIMPATASLLAPRLQNALLDPATNLDLGQRYIRALMRNPNIGENLLLLARAYNTGSSNSARLQRMLNQDDPLLAVESIQTGETRDFIEHVLANYWIYRARLGADTESLTDLAEGRWPLYHWGDNE